jgi:hypothetical protein
MGTPLKTVTTSGSSGSWTTAIPGPLADGTYTVQARQTADGLTGYSSPRTFVVSSTVDTTAPVVQIGAPVNGSSVPTTTPVISGTGGTAPGDASTVTVKVFTGTTATGTPRQTLSATVTAGGTWSVTPAALPQGAYTLQATQSDAAGNVGTSTTAVTVDTTRPVVRITSPANNAAVTTTSFTVSGTSGTAAGDGTQVTLKIYAGSGTTGTPVNTLTTTAAAGAWSTPVSGLGAGTYTLSASVPDAAGNVGVSANVVVQLRSAQTVTSVSPNAIGQGVTGRAVTINGSGFTAASTVAFSGAGVTLRSAAFVSSTRLSAVIDVAADATVARSNVVVSRAGTFDAICANCLIVNASPKPTSATPATLSRGLLKTVTINGTGFVAASQVTFSGGPGITVLFVTRTATSISLTMSVGGSAGVRNVTVTNPDGGTGTCVGCLTIT